MPIQAAASNDSIYLDSTTKATKKTNNNLTLTDFYKLMAAQLQNQSMYDTTDNSQYISQMLQFTELSQMQSMTNSVDSSTAVSMIGKSVNIATTDAAGNQSTVTGTVKGVAYGSGVPYLNVNDSYYKLSDVTSVKNAS